MPKAHHRTNKTVFSEDETSYVQESDTEEVSIRSPQASTSCAQESDSEQEGIIKSLLQVPTSRYVPYMEGPKMNWTVDDGLYNRFVKWKLKCENILGCELAVLSEARKCKKVVEWSGDFGIDQFISWDLTPEQTSLEIIWQKYEEFCKPQNNEIRARFDLLTSFHQGDHSVNEWYNDVQSQINLARYPQETARILQGDIFWFFLKDEDFVSKTINHSNIDLDKFQPSKVRQLAKKLGSSKSTAKHIKQVSHEPQAAKVNLMRCQCTELSHNKFQRKQRKFKPRQSNSRNQQEHQQYGRTNERMPQANSKFKQKETNTEDKGTRCGDTPHMQGFRCPASRHQCKYCKKIRHFSHMCFKKPQEQTYKKGPHKPQAHQLQVGRYSSFNQQYDQEDTSKSEDSFCLHMQIKPEQDEHEGCEIQYLLTHLEYKLKYHRRSTKFLRARIGTCSNVNVMLASIYKKIFKDPDFSKLTPNQSEGIYIYTSEKIPVIGSCELLV